MDGNTFSSISRGTENNAVMTEKQEFCGSPVESSSPALSRQSSAKSCISITALASEQFLSTRLIHFREVCIIPRPYRICPRHRPHLSWTSSNGRYGGLACLCLRSICKWSRGKHQGIPRFLPIFHIMTSAHPYKNIFQRTTILLKYCTLWKMQASIWIW